MGWPKKVADLPDGEFYAILTPESVMIPGDERSRTHPGHGYPEHTVEHWSMQTFPTRESWEAEIVRLTGLVFGREFKAVVIKPAVIKTTMKVEVC
jgi:hypothetical protein